MKVTDAKIILALVDAIDTGAPVEDRLLDQYRAKALQFLAAPTEESAQLDGSTPASQAGILPQILDLIKSLDRSVKILEEMHSLLVERVSNLEIAVAALTGKEQA